METDNDFQQHLLFSIKRDLHTLHAHHWLGQDTLRKVVELLDGKQRTYKSGEQNSLLVDSAPEKQDEPSTLVQVVDLPPEKQGDVVSRIPSSARASGENCAQQTELSSEVTVTALYDNEAVEDDDLAFRAGDLITDFELGEKPRLN